MTTVNATTDRPGQPLTTSHRASADRYDAAVESLLRFRDDVVDAWEATVADDPGFAMGHIGRAYLRCLSSEGPDAAEARMILDQLGDGAGLTDRERRHLDAARAYAEGDLHGAAERLSVLSVEHPRDALALAVGHQLDFFCGDAAGLRDRIGRSLLSWDHHDPWFGFLLGMHAFGLEECGLYAKAETVGMRALDGEPRDVWAHHAVLHVHEMEGRFRAGLRFAEERRAYWEEGNFFVPHNAWHKALFHLEEDNTLAALEIYDRVIHNAESAKVALEMLDAAALLWRLQLSDADVGGRWAPLADAWAEKVDEPPWYVFNDMHATMSLVAAGRLADARAVVDRLGTYVNAHTSPSLSNVSMTAEVGLPVCSAIVAFGEGRYGDVVRLLHPIRKIVYRFGGSHAQRDAVARTLLEAAIRGGETTLATALVSERLAIKDTSPFNWLQLARIRRADADLAEARGAEVTASDLRGAAA
jgi:hypothetical protein